MGGSEVLLKDESKSEALKSFFTRIGNTISSGISNVHSGNIDKYRTIKDVRDSIFLEPVHHEETLAILNGIDPDKSAGYDGIFALSLK